MIFPGGKVAHPEGQSKGKSEESVRNSIKRMEISRKRRKSETHTFFTFVLILTLQVGNTTRDCEAGNSLVGFT